MIRTLKYNDVKQRLIRYIFENRMREGDKLPCEQKLCALFGTSNLPLRRAEDELAQGGMLLRVKNRGVFVGTGWDRAHYTSRLGILSVGVADYPSVPQEEALKDILRQHNCDLRVFRTGHDISSEAIHELAECDYIIISGFVTQAWIEAVKALEKPVLHVGHTELVTGIPRVENDFADMFAKVFGIADRLEAKRLLVWMPLEEELSYARRMEAEFDRAIIKCGFDKSRIILDHTSCLNIRSCIQSLRRHGDAYDMLILRDYSLGALMCHREWGKLLGDRPVIALSTSRDFPNDFDMLPDIYRVRFPSSLAVEAVNFFFEWHNRLPDGAAVLKLKAEVCQKFDSASYWNG